MNDEQSKNLPANPEIANIVNEAQRNSSFQKRLTFNGNSGVYMCDGQEVAHGTKVVAHCIGWAQEWIKFADRRFIENRIYRISRGDRVPTRDQLDDNDEKLWANGRDRKPQDPWSLRFLLPMWSPETDDAMIFVTPSRSGQRAVSDLVMTYGRRAQRDPNCGQPIVRLQTAVMKTANFGSMQRPHFEIVGWDDGTTPVRDVPDGGGGGAASDMNDEIPF